LAGSYRPADHRQSPQGTHRRLLRGGSPSAVAGHSPFAGLHGTDRPDHPGIHARCRQPRLYRSEPGVRRAGTGSGVQIHAAPELRAAPNHPRIAVLCINRQRLRRRADLRLAGNGSLWRPHHPAEGPECGDGGGDGVRRLLRRRQSRHRHPRRLRRSAHPHQGVSLMSDATETLAEPRRLSNAYQNWYRFSRNPSAVIGAVIVIVFILAAIFAPLITPYPEHVGAVVDFRSRHLPPSSEHWFGTDNVGRDIFTRVIFGLRISLLLALVVLGTAVPIGTVLGLLAGYFGGWVEIVI